MKKLLSLILALALCLSLAACSQPAVESSEPAPESSPALSSEPAPETDAAGISFTDMTGREIKLDAPAEKIVVLTAGDCEILYAIGAGASVIGRGAYCNYPAEVEAVTAVESGNETNIEQIVALSPDAVVMGTIAQSKEQIAALENAGIAVVVSDANSIEESYENILMLGRLTGKNDEAEAVVANMTATFEELKAKVAGAESKKVYFEVSPLEWGLWAAGANTYMDEIADILGLENIFSDVEGWVEVSQEQVIERAPDYIFTITMFYGEGPTPVEEIMSRAGWENIPAVVNGGVCQIDSDAAARPGPRLADAAVEIYGLMYGE